MEKLIDKETITNVALDGVFLTGDDERNFEASL